MHPYHIKEYADERVADRLRSARYHQAVSLARGSQDDPGADSPSGRGRGLRIPFSRWEPRTQPARTMRAAR